MDGAPAGQVSGQLPEAEPRRAWLARLAREALPDLAWRRRVNLRRELFAGVAGALLVIPQAITFAYLTGVPPEFGLYCAIFAGFLSSLFGNSVLVGGPNTAVSILIGLTVIPFAGRGSPLFIEFVLVLSLAVGLIQLIIWLARGAELFRYFSPAAITGIKVGVGVLLITSGLESALGMSPLLTHFFYEKFYLAAASWHDVVNLCALAISAVTVVAGLLLRKRWPRAYIVLAMLVGSVVGGLIYGVLGPVASQLELLGHVRLSALPLTTPNLGPPQLLFLEQTFPSAVAIAVLGLAQTLVIARDLKATVDGNVDLHKEVFAQGIANALAPFFSTFAGSGSFNRTSVAIEMGARTPASGMIAAIAVALFAWGLEPLLTWLPMPVIAGVMALVGIGMMQSNDFRLLRNRVEGAVFALTLFAVIFLGLEVGILVAVLASIGFFVASVSKVGLSISRDGDEERIVVSGNLFYASLDRLAKHLRSNPAGRTVLDLSKVPYCDAAARAMMQRIQAERTQHGGRLEILSAS
jgi:sulfate permease, SulP family